MSPRLASLLLCICRIWIHVLGHGCSVKNCACFCSFLFDNRNRHYMATYSLISKPFRMTCSCSPKPADGDVIRSTMPENVVYAVQKRSNRSSCRLLEWSQWIVHGRAHWLHLANTVERLCAAAAAAMSGLPHAYVETWSVPENHITLGSVVNVCLPQLVKILKGKNKKQGNRR